MCVVVFDYQPDGSKPYILIVVSNRDEYYDRKTAQADFWNDNPVILAGKCDNGLIYIIMVSFSQEEILKSSLMVVHGLVCQRMVDFQL